MEQNRQTHQWCITCDNAQCGCNQRECPLLLLGQSGIILKYLNLNRVTLHQVTFIDKAGDESRLTKDYKERLIAQVGLLCIRFKLSCCGALSKTHDWNILLLSSSWTEINHTRVNDFSLNQFLGPVRSVGQVHSSLLMLYQCPPECQKPRHLRAKASRSTCWWHDGVYVNKISPLVCYKWYLSAPFHKMFDRLLEYNSLYNLDWSHDQRCIWILSTHLDELSQKIYWSRQT